MRVIDVALENVLVKENGRKASGEAINLLEFELVYPREGVSKVVSVKKAKLKDSELHTPDNTFEDQILFRETLRGVSQINVKVHMVRQPSAFESFFETVLKGFFTGALQVSTAGVSNVITGKTLETVGGSFIDSVSESKDAKITIGEASCPLDPDNLPTQIKLPLIVKKAVIVPKFSPDSTDYDYIDEVLLDTTENSREDNGTINLILTTLT